MRVVKEFSRFAKDYDRHNIIQAEVARKLISSLPQKQYRHILDIGCGSGEIWRTLQTQGVVFDSLTAFDLSAEMLDLHPCTDTIIARGDFNRPEDLASLANTHYDLMLSASALQWSSDLRSTLHALKPLADRCFFAIFTSGTFRTLHACAGISSPIHSEDYLREKLEECFDDGAYETVRYKLYFESVYAMLRYIKESGTSGGERRLSYLETKRLLDEYHLDYLEFEVLFAKGMVK
jgi:malonyl-CoA O-methyltransferase